MLKTYWTREEKDKSILIYEGLCLTMLKGHGDRHLVPNTSTIFGLVGPSSISYQVEKKFPLRQLTC